MSTGHVIEGGRGPLVLVVEDHPDTLSMVAEHLAEHGFRVVTASDGVTALQIVREQHPELVYLDVNLPHISGFDVCEQIRADPDVKDTAVLMTSARHTIDVRAYSLEAGADVYLPKPYDFEQLMKQVERLAGREEQVVATEPDESLGTEADLVTEQALGEPSGPNVGVGALT